MGTERLLRGPDTVERPHLGWWVAIPGGFGLIALLALSPSAYAFWREHVSAALSRGTLAALFVGAVLIHVGEALYARALARHAGLTASAGAWTLQTFLLGFPSLRLLRGRAGRG